MGSPQVDMSSCPQEKTIVRHERVFDSKTTYICDRMRIIYLQVVEKEELQMMVGLWTCE